jgi:uncharacterized protein YbdZ (MbtH family)
MPNVFDDPEGIFLVLKNAEDQHSLWPRAIDVPPGWATVHGPAPRADCMNFIRDNWTDMRPASLVAEMSAADR